MAFITKNNKSSILSCKKFAFSLIEILISLITISCITAAFTPVITKKLFKQNVVMGATEKKSGVEIYNSPGPHVFIVPSNITKLFLSAAGGGGGGAGAYSVAKSISFTTVGTTNWTVPYGVNYITLEITGAGGGGGAANGKEGADIPASAENNLSVTLKRDSCLADEFLAIRGAKSGQDLCITKKDLSFSDLMDKGQPVGNNALYSSIKNHQQGETCSALALQCCWNGVNSSCAADSSGARSGCNRPVCNKMAAENICSYYKTIAYNIFIGTNRYRMLDKSELETINKNRFEWSFNRGYDGLNLCTHGEDSAPYCYASWSCMGAKNNRCDFNRILGSEYNIWLQNRASTAVGSLELGVTGAVRCARELNRFSGKYFGAGGASGAQMNIGIYVLPKDTFEITIGKGGIGGRYGANANNGLQENEGNGTQGEITKVIHKRAGAKIGEYYVKGGFGGFGATNNDHGKILNAGVASGNTTPQGTCYANGNTACSILSYPGSKYSDKFCQSGGSVADKEFAQNCGFNYTDASRNPNIRATAEEINRAKGRQSATPGYGGGGGATPLWAVSSSDFYEGGNGANGRVLISYNLVLPGGGGGAAGTIGKKKDGTNLEIEYPVSPGQKLVFTVGAGGHGGSTQHKGSDGSSTVFGKNEIVFEGGKGGQIPTESEIAANKGGKGGAGGYFKKGSESKNKGGDGSMGQIQKNSIFLNYALDGGIGGATFLGYKGGCGGGIVVQDEISQNCNTAASQDGDSAEDYDPVDDINGGQGGGGGGASTTSGLGKGGNGANGFVKIRY